MPAAHKSRPCQLLNLNRKEETHETKFRLKETACKSIKAELLGQECKYDARPCVYVFMYLCLILFNGPEAWLRALAA